VPDWVAAGGAVFALAFGAIAARAAWDATKFQAKQLRQLEDAEERRVEDVARRQAANFATWLRLTGPPVRPVIVCFNGSNLPIYRLRITLRVHGVDYPDDAAIYATKGPDAQARVLEYATKKLVDKAESILAEEGEVIEWPSLYRTGAVSITARFVDADGVEWVRDERGGLTRG
jgi:hypothetical protein